MVALSALWMPLVLSAVGVFVVSAILHMALKYHQADYRKIPNQDLVLAELAKANLPPGLYQFPNFGSMKDCNTPEAKERFRRGPNGMLTMMPSGEMAMGKYLGLWFVYNLLVSLFVAYLAGHTVAAGVDYLAVFRVAGTAAFMSYGLAPFVQSIWYGAPWANTIRAMFDGLLYACVTAGFFGWLWPR